MTSTRWAGVCKNFDHNIQLYGNTAVEQTSTIASPSSSLVFDRTIKSGSASYYIGLTQFYNNYCSHAMAHITLGSALCYKLYANHCLSMQKLSLSLFNYKRVCKSMKMQRDQLSYCRSSIVNIARDFDATGSRG